MWSSEKGADLVICGTGLLTCVSGTDQETCATKKKTLPTVARNEVLPGNGNVCIKNTVSVPAGWDAHGAIKGLLHDYRPPKVRKTVVVLGRLLASPVYWTTTLCVPKLSPFGSTSCAALLTRLIVPRLTPSIRNVT
jgi:hypothetical protein